MFSQACVILFTGGCLPQCMLGYTPWEQTPPRADTPHLGTRPLRSRHPPWPLGADPPQTRHPQTKHPPGPDPPEQTPRSIHPLEQTPLEQTPPEQTHHPPPDQTPPSPGTRHPLPRDQTHPTPQSMLGDTVNTRAVRILLECNLVSLFFKNISLTIYYFL